MSEDRDGFEINGRFYPWAQQMRTLDPLLIREVTGMAYNEFLEAWKQTLASLEDDGEPDIDPVVMNGLVAVAFWQQHTDWSRAKVVRFFERLNQDDVELIGGDTDEEEGKESDPLSDAVGGSTESGSSSTTPSLSNGSQESPSETIPPSTGPRMSATSSQGSHRPG